MDLEAALKLRESLILSLQWLVDLGIYSSYGRSLDTGLFMQNKGHLEIVLNEDGTNQELNACISRPIDQRIQTELFEWKNQLGTTMSADKTGKLKLVHVKNILQFLLYGLTASTITFVLELLMYHLTSFLEFCIYIWEKRNEMGKEKASWKSITRNKVINPLNTIHRLK